MTKNVALFLDGTWKREEADGDSNVYRLYRMANETAGTHQVCHYISGVGTDCIKKFREINALRRRARLADESSTITSRCFRKYVGGLTGFGIEGKIKEAYAFLVENYDARTNDRVYLFGFSRGAFAARSLASFINEVGLLLRKHIYLVPEAYEIYRTGKGREFLAKFLEHKLGRPVSLGEAPIPVYLIGVWDTVGALGFPPPLDALSFNTHHHHTLVLPSNVTHARHALALHELRQLYQPSPWVKSASHQSLAQVWFAGAHADVGGGYASSGLSDISLLWIAKQAVRLHLALDYGRIDTRPDPRCSINQELKFPHSLFDFRCRNVLDQLSQDDPDPVLETHSIHPSVVQRILMWRAKAGAYQINAPIRKQLDRVDQIALQLAIRHALRADPLPETEESQSLDIYRDRFFELLLDLDPNNSQHIKDLTTTIALASILDGTQGVYTLDDALEKCVVSLISSPVAGTDPSARIRQWTEATIAGLRKVVEDLPSGAVRRYVQVLLLREKLSLKLPPKTGKRPPSKGVMKI